MEARSQHPLISFFQADRKNKMAAPVSHWLRLFDFNESWQEARFQHPLPSLRFFGQSVNKNGHPVWSVKKVAHCTQVHVMWPFGPLVCGSYAPIRTKNTGNTHFSALFSYMLWQIELKFCIWLCYFTVLETKFECHQFASIFGGVGVMPLLEHRILEIHSILHFSLTCFGILSWNFTNDFLAHLSQRLKWAIVIAHRPSSVRPSVVRL